MSKFLTEDEVRDLVRSKSQDEWGAGTRLAQEWGVSRVYISNVANGHKAPGKAILRMLGLRKRVVYERIR